MSDAIGQVQIVPQFSPQQQLIGQLREMILSGRLEEGYKFPSNNELCEKWGFGYTMVQSVMARLAKDRLVVRVPKRGTFVAKRSQQLTRVGIYLRSDIWHAPRAAFSRTLVSQLCEQLHKTGVETEILIDSRAREDRHNPLPELVRAAEQRRVQALLMPEVITLERPWVSQLRLPWVEWAADPIPNRVIYQREEEERLAATELARMGCRSVGLITPSSYRDQSLRAAGKMRSFERVAESLGMRINDNWLDNEQQYTEFLGVPESESERYGYEAMRRLLALPDRPDGVYVTHDWVARGAITAILENKVVVPDELKLVFFRNREVDWVCPVPAAFVEASIAEVAKAMIDMMRALLRGEDVTPVTRSTRIVPTAIARTSAGKVEDETEDETEAEVEEAAEAVQVA